MGLKQVIEAIRENIRLGRFPNEAAVSQGIVLRLLHALDWPAYDTQTVWPEYSLSGRRVDYALCHPPGKPIALVEVKQIGQSEGAERQLFEYAFHEGVPMAILTDGQEWNFFLPGEQGDYGERRVYKLDILDRDIEECVNRLERYLLHSAVTSGSAMQAARDDYRNVSRDRQMLAALPRAWHQITTEQDEMLLEIVADRVESLCGFKPGPDVVAKFLEDSVVGRAAPQSRVATIGARPATVTQARAPSPPVSLPTAHRVIASQAAASSPLGFSLHGKFHVARNAIDTLKQVFEELTLKDSSFPVRFGSLPRHGRTRRYLAMDANDLYPGRADLVRDCSVQLSSGWWMATNHSKQTIAKVIAMACDVAQVDYGRELVAQLGD